MLEFLIPFIALSAVLFGIIYLITMMSKGGFPQKKKLELERLLETGKVDWKESKLVQLRLEEKHNQEKVDEI